jgi:microcystin-dependent protein
MSTPYIGEIRAFGFTFAPYQWAQCNGQTIAISQNDTLYALIGTTYGGDGQSTFNLPNLQGRVPIHQGTNALTGLSTTIGQVQGNEYITLTTPMMPAHNHAITVGQVPSGGVVDRSAGPTSASYLSDTVADGVWFNGSPTLNATAAGGAIGLSGNSQPHENRQPYLVINFCIALYGIYPSQN